MTINWLGYYLVYNGYGHLTERMVLALEQMGVDVVPTTFCDMGKPLWLRQRMGLDFDNLTITCAESEQFKPVSSDHWLYTMCEGTYLQPSFLKRIRKSLARRIVLPCQFCADVFRANGVKLPISVVPMGTDPDEFPAVQERPGGRPYTFLALADRGSRKGWHEAYTAFYKAFGGRTNGNKDVRLIIKALPHSNMIVDKMQRDSGLDPRIQIDTTNYERMADLYNQADCVVMPSRNEGWGMPHREAAMMGLPVIVQPYSGLDDGFTEQWALVVTHGRLVDVPLTHARGGGGEWLIADTDEVADMMLRCYNDPAGARWHGACAREWLIANQTWQHSAAKLVALLEEEGYGFQMDRRPARVDSGDHAEIHTNGVLVG